MNQGDEVPIPTVGYSRDMIGETVVVRQPALGGGVIERRERLAGICPFTGFIRTETDAGRTLFHPQEDCFLIY